MATILGLDIDPQTVRAVAVRTALRKTEIVGYYQQPIEPLPPPEEGEGGIAMTDAEPEDAQLAAVRRAIRGVLGSLAQPPDKVITELSGDEVSIRKASLPAKAAKKLDELLPFELEGKVPFDITESIVDHQPIETVDGELRMHAAVVPRERIAAHLGEMRMLGLEPRHVAVGAVALDGLVPLVPQLTTPGPHALIDIHPEGTDVCILMNGVCHFARTLSVTIADLDAGRQSVLERELRQTMAAWRMEGGSSPSTFFVCGQMAIRPGTDAWLGQIVGAPVETLQLPQAPGADEAVRPAFARAAALSGRALARGKHLDARQGPFATKQAATALRQHLPLIASCAAAIVASFIFSSYARYSVLEARHQQLEDQLAEVTQEYFGVEARSPETALLQLSRGARGDDPMPEFDAYDALEALSAAIPTEVTHDVRQLQIDLGDGDETGRFSLRGSVDSVSDTELVVQSLRNHRVIRTEGDTETRLQCFHELDLGNTTATAEERRSYRLEGQIRCVPEGQELDEEEGSRRGRRGRRND
ncbi:MAG: hypothetical protein VYE22_24995 [Myxococcota bacterium]|nr:hypothetical protein [Myxococcota bacterium]